ncbi:MAG: hypothetical protein Q8L76_15325, partial [Cypionkella sp.]|nr:hypothetical protein [Cypionkella sp.]
MTATDWVATLGTEQEISLSFGDLVRVTDSEGAVKIYKFMGASDLAARDLGEEDYAGDTDYWRETLASKAVPAISIMGGVESSVGLIVVLNDLQSSVEARIEDAVVTTTGGDIVISADLSSQMTVLVDASVTQSGGAIATNVLQGGALAHAVDASLTATTGDVSVLASNETVLDATTKMLAETGDDSFTLTMAFNTVGWRPTNMLFNAVDTLIGDPAVSSAFSGENPVDAVASITRTSVDADGAVLVSAENLAVITSDTSNNATSEASDLSGASGSVMGAMLSLNKVSGAAQALINGTTATLANLPDTISAGGGVTVTAVNQSEIDSINTLAQTTSVTNDLGLSIAVAFVDAARNDYDYTTYSGSQNLRYGQVVRIGSNPPAGTTEGDLYLYGGNNGASADRVT